MMDLLRRKSIREFIKFSLVGASGTVIDWLIYFIFSRWLGVFYLIAKTISFIIAAANNYLLNRVWTFRSQDNRIVLEFGKFFIVSLVGLGLNVLLMYLAVDIIGWGDFIGLIIATGLVMFWNFFANKYWTFRGGR